MQVEEVRTLEELAEEYQLARKETALSNSTSEFKESQHSFTNEANRGFKS